MARHGIIRAMGDPVYLSAAEAASRLGISLRTIRRRIADGSLPSARIGHAVRIPADALELPVARGPEPAAREAAARDGVVPYGRDPDRDRAAHAVRWNAEHWPDTFERMLAQRRRAFDVLDAIRERSKPPSGPHGTVDAIIDAVREEAEARFDWIIAGLPEPPEAS
jgi:excisionase family DNA binding protein